MECLKPKIKDYPGQLIELMSDNADFEKQFENGY
jgi:hypothetical protein